MSSYRGTADRAGRAKALAAALAANGILAAVILTGLNVRMVSHAVERLATFDVLRPPPPPPERQPPPPPKSHRTSNPEGQAGRRAQPSPIVAPPPRIPLRSALSAAKVAGAGSASTSGGASSGTGTGAGESGTGTGGGDYSGFTPARRISKIPDSEYRRLASTGLQSGRVGVTVRVSTDGNASNCRVARSSGDGSIDALMCQLTTRYVRFDPARDSTGRPVAQDVTFFPNWWRP